MLVSSDAKRRLTVDVRGTMSEYNEKRLAELVSHCQHHHRLHRDSPTHTRSGKLNKPYPRKRNHAEPWCVIEEFIRCRPH